MLSVALLSQPSAQAKAISLVEPTAQDLRTNTQKR
jgi:hypothetical protein